MIASILPEAEVDLEQALVKTGRCLSTVPASQIPLRDCLSRFRNGWLAQYCRRDASEPQAWILARSRPKLMRALFLSSLQLHLPQHAEDPARNRRREAACCASVD